jgi:hypothetical protein
MADTMQRPIYSIATALGTVLRRHGNASAFLADQRKRERLDDAWEKSTRAALHRWLQEHRARRPQFALPVLAKLLQSLMSVTVSLYQQRRTMNAKEWMWCDKEKLTVSQEWVVQEENLEYATQRLCE